MSPAIENNVYALLEGVGSCGSISVQDPASPSWKLQTTVREGFRPLPVPARSVASVVSNSVWPCGRSPARLLCPWDSQGKNTGVGCHFLLQRIFLTQGSNLHLLHHLHCRWILYCWTKEAPYNNRTTNQITENGKKEKNLKLFCQVINHAAFLLWRVNWFKGF